MSIESEQAFNKAIELGYMTTNEVDFNYAGNYMYMSKDDVYFNFKNINTRNYYRVLTHHTVIDPVANKKAEERLASHRVDMETLDKKINDYKRSLANLKYLRHELMKEGVL